MVHEAFSIEYKKETKYKTTTIKIRGYCDSISCYNFFLDNDRNLIQCECISCYYFKVTNKIFFFFFLMFLESVFFN